MAQKKSKKHIAVVYRPHKPKAYQVAKELSVWLKLQGVTIYSHPDQKPIPGTNLVTKKNIKQLDYIVAIGGDGTYLRAIRFFNAVQIPLIGVNMGYLGFLTEVNIHNMYAVLTEVLTDKIKFNERTMLDVTVTKQHKNISHHLALNDVVIERGPISRLISISIFSNNSLITELKADGLIISSPTGSTAYNLAAGGPIVHPEVKAIVITPICAHSLTMRPITLPDNHTITIKLSPSPTKAVFMIDGQKSDGLTDKDTIVIKKSKVGHTKLILDSHDYFDVLRKKLNFGQRD